MMILTLPSLFKATYEQATLLGVVVFLLTALLSYLPTRSVKYFPGPKPWPILGNFIYFRKVLSNLYVELPQMAKDFGGTCMVWMGQKPTLLIHSLEDAHEILTKVSIQENRPAARQFFHPFFMYIVHSNMHIESINDNQQTDKEHLSKTHLAWSLAVRSSRRRNAILSANLHRHSWPKTVARGQEIPRLRN
jgi:hypothetical protein